VWVLELFEDLHAKRKSAGGGCTGTSDVIFTTPSGLPIDSDNLAKRFKSILERAGFPLIRLYDLRHTGATLGVIAGVPPNVVSEQLGHASAAFTLDVYSRVLPHMQEEAAMKMQEVLMGRHILPRRSRRAGVTSGLLRTVANAWNPTDIQDPATNRKSGHTCMLPNRVNARQDCRENKLAGCG
jgi:hypothetical protein